MGEDEEVATVKPPVGFCGADNRAISRSIVQKKDRLFKSQQAVILKIFFFFSIFVLVCTFRRAVDSLVR